MTKDKSPDDMLEDKGVKGARSRENHPKVAPSKEILSGNQVTSREFTGRLLETAQGQITRDHVASIDLGVRGDNEGADDIYLDVMQSIGVVADAQIPMPPKPTGTPKKLIKEPKKIKMTYVPPFART